MSTDRGSAVVVVAAPVDPRGLQALCAEVGARLRAGEDRVVVELGPRMPASLCVVDAVARLQLAARRAGGVVVLRGVGPRLLELLELAGLTEVVDGPADAG